jgi:hypothetical protein
MAGWPSWGCFQWITGKNSTEQIAQHSVTSADHPTSTTAAGKKGQKALAGLTKEIFVPSSYQYPVEKDRDLQRRWGRLLQRIAAPNEVRNNYRRAEEDHNRQALLGLKPPVRR